MQVKGLEEEKQRKQKLNQQSNVKGKKSGEAKGEQKKNPCRKHDGAHDFKDCAKEAKKINQERLTLNQGKRFEH